MSMRSGVGWLALGVWLSLGIACTGAYDRPLPVEFVPGEFVAVQTEAAVELYRVEANGEFVARGTGASVSEAAFDGRAGVVLWRLKAENLRWYDPELDDFLVPSLDDMLEELTVEAEDTCECPHLVFPTLIPLAPGASCPVPPEMASAFRWDGGEWAAVTGEPPGLFLRRSTSEVSCIEKVSLDDFIAGPNELPPEPRVVSLEAYTATTGVMRGLLQHGEFLYVVGDRGWIVLDVESLEVRPEYGMWGVELTIDAWSRGSSGEAIAIVSPAGSEPEVYAALAEAGPEPGLAFVTSYRVGVRVERPRLARALGRRRFLVLETAGLRVYERMPDESPGTPTRPWRWEANGLALVCEGCAARGFEGASSVSFGIVLALSDGLWLVSSAQPPSEAPQALSAAAPQADAWIELQNGPVRTLVRRSGGRAALHRVRALVTVDGEGDGRAVLTETADAPMPEVCAESTSKLMLVPLGGRAMFASEAGVVWYLGGERCAPLEVRGGRSVGPLVDALPLPPDSRGGARAILLDAQGRLLEFLAEPR